MAGALRTPWQPATVTGLNGSMCWSDVATRVGTFSALLLMALIVAQSHGHQPGAVIELGRHIRECVGLLIS